MYQTDRFMDIEKHHFINTGGRLTSLDTPRVMGILNVTPDSFYAASRTRQESDIARRAEQIVAEGGTFIDVGGYSTRPSADDVSAAEEMERLRRALGVVRRVCPDTPLSVDTFRADVARMCVEEFGADIINDISGGELDPQMFDTVARLHVPYVLTHMQGTPHDMQQHPHYDNVVREVFLFLAQRVQRLHQMGVADVILDPGFGFGKTLEHNYQLLAQLDAFAVFGLPLLVGVSRKSMVYRLLDSTPEAALNGTTVLHTLCLQKGADILRVHDVKEAVEAIRIVGAMRQAAAQEADNNLITHP